MIGASTCLRAGCNVREVEIVMSLLKTAGRGLLQTFSELAGKTGFVLVMMGAVALFVDFRFGLPALLLGALLLVVSFRTWQGRAG